MLVKIRRRRSLREKGLISANPNTKYCQTGASKSSSTSRRRRSTTGSSIGQGKDLSLRTTYTIGRDTPLLNYRESGKESKELERIITGKKTSLSVGKKRKTTLYTFFTHLGNAEEWSETHGALQRRKMHEGKIQKSRRREKKCMETHLTQKITPLAFSHDEKEKKNNETIRQRCKGRGEPTTACDGEIKSTGFIYEKRKE